MATDIVLSVLIEQVLKASDISEAACAFVNSLFASILTSAGQCFHEGEIEAKASCKHWNKFFAIGKFMNLSLSDISQGLANGLFRSLTGPELSMLIRATFAESDKRESLLLALSSSD